MTTIRKGLQDYVVNQRKRYSDEKHLKQYFSDYQIAHKDEWAYCPECKLEWNSKYVIIPFLCIPVNQKARHLVKANVEDKEKRPDKLCPIHGESIIDGRRMGPLTYVDKRTLNKINKSGRIHCPKCENYDLEQMDNDPESWKCQACNSQICTNNRYQGDPSGKTQVVDMVYREDLDTANELLLEMVQDC